MFNKIIEIPYEIIIINPAIDLFVFLLIQFSITFYFLYFKMKDVGRIAFLDFKLSLIVILFLYFNYKGTEIDFNFLGLDYKIGWVWYYLILTFILELFFFAIFN